LFADVFARWQVPVILCARTTLGTINHTLLSLEALKHRAMPILGVAFIGDENAETQRVIAEIGGIRSLGRLPWLSRPTPKTLQEAFGENIDIGHIKAALS
jgi:dethiobiotin synthetase